MYGVGVVFVDVVDGLEVFEVGGEQFL